MVATSPTTSTPTPEQSLARALGYPYSRPEHSFLFPSPSPIPALSPSVEAAHLSNPALNFVLSIGSNAAPSRLLAKFGPNPPHPIPVLAVTVTGLDVVHAAEISSYGSVPATVLPSPSATLLATHATLLDDALLAAMNATEHGYALVRIRTDAVRLRSGSPLPPDTHVLAYVHHAGPLRAPDTRPRALASFHADHRVWNACEQRDALALALSIARDAGVAHPDEQLDDFVLHNIRDHKRRAAVIDSMRKVSSTAPALDDSNGLWHVVQLL